ncbi:MAG TPA: hypothetical protein VK252_08170 [Solirubrobacteraceae bacterium]|nr:hypothetical protein [Solirubrobacteraceae bacterium]
MHVLQGWQAKARAGFVELVAPTLQASLDRGVRAPPQRAAHRRARQAGAERVDGEVRRHVWVDVGDQRRARPAVDLRRQRGGQREDVRHHHVWGQLAHQRDRVRGRMHHRLIEVQRLRTRGEDLVLRRRRERQALILDVLLPARPRLQRHLMPARRQRAPQRDHREGVARVAERAQQDAHQPARRRA